MQAGKYESMEYKYPQYAGEKEHKQDDSGGVINNNNDTYARNKTYRKGIEPNRKDNGGYE